MSKLIAVVGLVVAMSGCQWWAQHGASVASDSLATIACVVNAAEAKQTIEQIGVSCGLPVLADVASILVATGTPVVSSPALVGVMSAHPAMKVVVRK